MPKVKSVFLDFVRQVVSGDIDEVSRRLAASPSLAAAPAEVGAARQGAPDFFFTEIAHYLYAGDTALHVAAWRANHDVVRELIARRAPLNALDSKGRSAMMLAVKACVDSYWMGRRQPDSVKALLDAGASTAGVDLPCGYDEVDTLLLPRDAS